MPTTRPEPDRNDLRFGRPEGGSTKPTAVYGIRTLSSKGDSSADLLQQGCWLISARTSKPVRGKAKSK
jgi:hypothetical protein